jgi:GNAT superfamily N-acetyltransferase
MTPNWFADKEPLERTYQRAKQVTLLPAEQQALAFLLPLSEDYPGIDLWFRSKVVPGLRLGTRTLLRVERDSCLVGLGIGKRELTERKICTVRVAPSHIGRGIGPRLFDSLLRWLDVDKPHLTVSEGKFPIYRRIFDRYGFNLTSIQVGRYVPHLSELNYNESSVHPAGRASLTWCPLRDCVDKPI